MGIISRILDLDSSEEEYYFLKLEALWILINLSMCDTDEIKLLFLSDFNNQDFKNLSSIAEKMDYAEMEFEGDQRSEILQKVEIILNESLN